MDQQDAGCSFAGFGSECLWAFRVRLESGAGRSTGRTGYRLGVRGGCPTGKYGGSRIVVAGRGDTCCCADHARRERCVVEFKCRWYRGSGGGDVGEVL